MIGEPHYRPVMRARAGVTPWGCLPGPTRHAAPSAGPWPMPLPRATPPGRAVPRLRCLPHPEGQPARHPAASCRQSGARPCLPLHPCPCRWCPLPHCLQLDSMPCVQQGYTPDNVTGRSMSPLTLFCRRTRAPSGGRGTIIRHSGLRFETSHKPTPKAGSASPRSAIVLGRRACCATVRRTAGRW